MINSLPFIDVEVADIELPKPTAYPEEPSNPIPEPIKITSPQYSPYEKSAIMLQHSASRLETLQIHSALSRTIYSNHVKQLENYLSFYKKLRDEKRRQVLAINRSRRDAQVGVGKMLKDIEEKKRRILDGLMVMQKEKKVKLNS